ncbi:MAG: Uma2 family endonuclease [Planctomycetales bacterium]|nr:Uma2 family endonuclease [Planctomycetales bacterium]
MMSTVASNAETVVTLYDVGWEIYDALTGDDHSHGGRITYDQGVMEIMSPSIEHEQAKWMIARMVESTAEALGIDIQCAGSTTFKNDASRRGIEPDECYYIQHADCITGKERIDLSMDPPPDLAIEVGITRSSAIKMGVYAALGVPEVWRYDGESVTLIVLGKDGGYVEAEQSPALPQLPFGELTRFLNMLKQSGQTKSIRAFRDWVHKEIVTE